MKAWIENGVVRDVAHSAPEDIYMPEIAALYDTEVPEGTAGGATLVGDEWTNPAVEVPAAPAAPDIEVSPIEFKLLFTVQEGVALYESEDPAVKYFLSLVDDPRLTTVNLGLDSTHQSLMYLVSLGLLTPDRADQILTGAPI